MPDQYLAQPNAKQSHKGRGTRSYTPLKAFIDGSKKEKPTAEPNQQSRPTLAH